MTNTFDHEAALHGARIYCDDQDVTDDLRFDRDTKRWYSSSDDFDWDMKGQPDGGYPPLTTL